MRRSLRIVVPVIAVIAALVVAELTVRALDGHRFDSLRLQPRNTTPGEYAGKWQEAADVGHLVDDIAVAPGVDPKWFALQIPAPTRRPADPELAARAKANPGLELVATYEWNRHYVQKTLCNDDRRRSAVFDRVQDLFIFEPSHGGEHPTYRYLRHASYPSTLQTNAFGWRGSEITLEKPPQTIRIAFVGASTTVASHGDPHSYPELIEIWLNLWALTARRGLRFEVLNTAREGTDTRSMRSIVQDELLPLEPDLVVFYEGSNHFWPADFISDPLPPRPLAQVIDQPGPLAQHSAVAARARNLFLRGPVVGDEAEKPTLAVHWPADLDESAPDVTDRRLPSNLGNVVEDFDRMRGALEQIGARFVLTSFTWLVYDGMRLNPRRDAGVFRYLNETFWPFSYAHMRRYLDFQNVVYRRYAAQHQLDFIDYDAQFPKDPRLFYDAIHLTRAGIRLQAWIILQGIMPIIERETAAGHWPREDRDSLAAHPAFRDERRLVPVATLAASCGRSVE